MSYRNLEIWQLARTCVKLVHGMTMTELPSFEMYEEASQIRRSMKSVKSNIVEGYGRKRYPQEYIRFIVFSLASNDETIDHLENLYETGSLKNKELYETIHSKLETLGKKTNLFLQALERSATKPKVKFYKPASTIHLSEENKLNPEETQDDNNQ